MEELPSEIVENIYTQLSPRSYRRFSEAGKRYQELSQDPYLLKPVIVKDPNGKWACKTNGRGDCLNTLTYSEFKIVNDSDLIDGMFIYEYKYLWNNVKAECPFGNDGYLNGLMKVAYSYSNTEIYELPIVKGKVHGKVIYPPQRSNPPRIYNLGVIVSPNNYTFLKSIRWSGVYSFKFKNFEIGYDNYHGYILNLITPDNRLILSEDMEKYEIFDNKFQIIGYKQLDEISGYLPNWLTSSNVPIYINNIYDIILPVGLFNCKSLQDIQQNIEFMINRYRFYINSSLF